MKNILKFIFITLIYSFLFQSCRDENNVSWETAVPSFKLYDTALGSNTLYPTMENNPFQLVWDKYGTSNTYTVVYSETSDFSKSITLATTTNNSYTSTIGELNTALLQAGYSPYAAKQVYFRILTAGSGSDISVSNTLSFSVTPYPVTIPVITSPSSGSSFILDSKNPQNLVTKVVWSDYSTYGVGVNYLVEIAASGSSNFVALGSVTNLKFIDLTNKSFNDAVLKAGGQANVVSNFDIRLTAKTQSTGGTISKVSDIITIKVTPYVAFKNLFLVGDATAAGWNPNNNNQAIFRDPSNTNKFYFTGKFNSGYFKLIEVLGQWAPMWGINGLGSLVYRPTESDPDPGSINTFSAGYYSFEVDILAKTYSLTPYSGAMTSYTAIDLAGNLNNWGGGTMLTQSSFDSHQWYYKDLVVSSNGEAKFRAPQHVAGDAWAVNWGSATEFSGQGTQGGANIPLNAGTYDVYFNDIDGRYQFVKK